MQLRPIRVDQGETLEEYVRDVCKNGELFCCHFNDEGTLLGGGYLSMYHKVEKRHIVATSDMNLPLNIIVKSAILSIAQRQKGNDISRCAVYMKERFFPVEVDFSLLTNEELCFLNVDSNIIN